MTGDLWTRRAYRLLAVLLPARFRATHTELEDAAVACIDRAHARAGVVGVALAWSGIVIDTIVSAWTTRADDRRRRGIVDRWRTDLRDAWRAVAVRRGSSIAIIAIFGLGVGLVATMFALADPYVLRPLPYAHPEDLVVVRVGTEGLTPGAVVPTTEDWRQRRDLFSGLAAFYCCSDAIRLPQMSVVLSPREVEPGFLEVLGVGGPLPPVTASATDAPRPLLFTPAGVRAAGAIATAGGLLRSNKGSYQVIGRLSGSFLFPDPSQSDVRALTTFAPDFVTNANWVQAPGGRVMMGMGSGGPSLIGRLQPGVTPEIVRQALAVRLPSGRDLDVRVESLTAHMRGDLVVLGWGTLVAGLLVLAVCAGNIGNLFLARDVWRAQEFHTRQALGATRHDLGRLRFLEIVILSATAAAFGLALTAAALVAISGVVPDQYVTLGAPVLSWRVMSCAFLATIAVAGVALVPAAVFSGAASRTPWRGMSVRPRISVLRVTFTVGQSALAMVLVIGAAMLAQSFFNLVRQTTGYDSNSISITAAYPRLLPYDERVADSGGHLAEMRRTIESLRRIPGVTAVGATNAAVVGDAMVRSGIVVNGKAVGVDSAEVTSEFFAASGMHLVAGRGLTDDDKGARGVVVNQAFVRAFLPDDRSVGSQFGRVGSTRQPVVVGVVRDVYDMGLDVAPTPKVYMLLDGSHPYIGHAMYVARGLALTPASGGAIRRAVHEVNPNTIVEKVDTIGHRLLDSVRARVFAALLLSLFGVVAGVVTVAGLASMIAFLIASRTREIAIRVALGAEPSHIRVLVVREALSAAVIGGSAGLIVGKFAAVSLRSFVYGIDAGNWPTTVAAGLAIAAVQVVMALAMAQRAVALRPSNALRAE
jgi:predicted permease